MSNQLLQKSIKQYADWQAVINDAKHLANIVRTEAKRATALARQGEKKGCAEKLSQTATELKELSQIIKKYPSVQHEGFYKEAVEEYTEAKMFADFLSGRDTALPAFVRIAPEETIAAAADTTGELVRHAVNIAHGPGAVQEIERYRAYAQSVAHEIAAVSHAGKLRQKHDEVERNLHRLEQILYDLRLKKSC